MKILIAAALIVVAAEVWLVGFVLRGPKEIDPTDESRWDDDDLW